MKALKKTLTFRILATISTGLITFYFTNNFVTSVNLAGTQAIANSGLYFLHEKYWEKEQPKEEIKSMPKEWKGNI